MNPIIKQIIPADSDHRAVFIEGKRVVIESVICWVLCEVIDDENKSRTKTIIVPAVAYSDTTIQQLNVITDDVDDFWCMLKPGEEPPNEDEVREEVANRQRDLGLRRFKTKLLLELASKPVPNPLFAGSPAWIYQTEQAMKNAADRNPQVSEKYEAYLERVRQYSAGNDRSGH